MERTIRDINSMELKAILKGLTGLNFQHSSDGPAVASYTLQAQNAVYMNSPCLEWASKTTSGLLLISSPLTKQTYWSLPDDVDLGYIDRHEAEQQIMSDYEYFLENIEQAAYAVSSDYGVNIKMDKNQEPRLYTFLSNTKTEDDLINAINCFENLLPQLLMTA